MDLGRADLRAGRLDGGRGLNGWRPRGRDRAGDPAPVAPPSARCGPRRAGHSPWPRRATWRWPCSCGGTSGRATPRHHHVRLRRQRPVPLVLRLARPRHRPRPRPVLLDGHVPPVRRQPARQHVGAGARGGVGPRDVALRAGGIAQRRPHPGTGMFGSGHVRPPAPLGAVGAGRLRRRPPLRVLAPGAGEPVGRPPHARLGRRPAPGRGLRRRARLPPSARPGPGGAGARTPAGRAVLRGHRGPAHRRDHRGAAAVVLGAYGWRHRAAARAHARHALVGRLPPRPPPWSSWRGRPGTRWRARTTRRGGCGRPSTSGTRGPRPGPTCGRRRRRPGSPSSPTGWVATRGPRCRASTSASAWPSVAVVGLLVWRKDRKLWFFGSMTVVSVVLSLGVEPDGLAALAGAGRPADLPEHHPQPVPRRDLPVAGRHPRPGGRPHPTGVAAPGRPACGRAAGVGGRRRRPGGGGRRALDPSPPTWPPPSRW